MCIFLPFLSLKGAALVPPPAPIGTPYGAGLYLTRLLQRLSAFSRAARETCSRAERVPTFAGSTPVQRGLASALHCLSHCLRSPEIPGATEPAGSPQPPSHPPREKGEAPRTYLIFSMSAAAEA